MHLEGKLKILCREGPQTTGTVWNTLQGAAESVLP